MRPSSESFSNQLLNPIKIDPVKTGYKSNQRPVIRSRGERRSAFANFKIDKLETGSKNSASRATTGMMDREEILSPLLYASKISVEEEIGVLNLGHPLSTTPLPDYMYDLDLETDLAADAEACVKKEGFFSSKKV